MAETFTNVPTKRVTKGFITDRERMATVIQEHKLYLLRILIRCKHQSVYYNTHFLSSNPPVYFAETMNRSKNYKNILYIASQGQLENESILMNFEEKEEEVTH